MKRAKKSSLQKLFPDTKVEAYYDPFSQIINLSRYDKVDFENLDLRSSKAVDIDKISLFEHELTHWLDHISTLWGQRNIVLVYNALNARANNNIDEFWRIKQLFTGFSSDDFFHYFTEEYNLHLSQARYPWKYQITSGIRFSESGRPEYNRPILFLKFNCFDDIPIIRVPVSVASILESNAINAEFAMKISLSHSIKNVIERNLNLTTIKSDWLSMLYDKDFALYTVVAHLTSNLNNHPDVDWAYKTAASIGTIVLNLPNNIYEKMKLIEIKDAEWNRRIHDFQNIRDIGFCFFNLIKNLVDSKGKRQYSIEDLLKCSSLPTKEQLEYSVIEEMGKIKDQLIEGPFKNMAQATIEKGIEIFKIRGIDGNKSDFRSKLLDIDVLPKIMFGDTYFDDSNFKISEILDKLNKNSDLTLEEVYLTCEYYDKKFMEFVNACGI